MDYLSPLESVMVPFLLREERVGYSHLHLVMS